MRILWPLINAVKTVFAWIWTIACITIALIASAIRRRPEPGLTFARCVWSPGILRLAGANLEVAGRERLEQSRAYFFAANHQSWIDVPTLLVALPLPVLFLAKRELARVPFVGRFIERMGMVFVNRTDRREAARTVGHALERLRQGRSILSFPEGTRTLDGRVHRFKTATFAAALDAGAPVVPVALEGADRVLPRDSLCARPGLIRVRIGEPIPTAGLSRHDRGKLAERVQREVESLLEEMPTRSDR